MSDVPATALWLLAVWLALRSSGAVDAPGRQPHLRALAAGLAAALAITVRPGLVLLAIPVLGLCLLPPLADDGTGGDFGQGASWLLAGLVVGPRPSRCQHLLVRLASGHGVRDPGDVFALEPIWANVRHYSTLLDRKSVPIDRACTARALGSGESHTARGAASRRDS